MKGPSRPITSGELAYRIRTEKIGLTLRWFAGQLGISFSYLSDAERGRRAMTYKLAKDLDRQFAKYGSFASVVDAARREAIARWERGR
jgi:transcriptional regulator with XRE-family HTH domain